MLINHQRKIGGVKKSRVEMNCFGSFFGVHIEELNKVEEIVEGGENE